jgi:hypothetical protein
MRRDACNNSLIAARCESLVHICTCSETKLTETGYALPASNDWLPENVLSSVADVHVLESLCAWMETPCTISNRTLPQQFELERLFEEQPSAYASHQHCHILST